jgi:hypothetical protein
MSSEMAIRVLAQQSVMRSMKIYWKGGERRSFSFLIIIYLSFLKKKTSGGFEILRHDRSGNGVIPMSFC